MQVERLIKWRCLVIAARSAGLLSVLMRQYLTTRLRKAAAKHQRTRLMAAKLEASRLVCSVAPPGSIYMYHLIYGAISGGADARCGVRVDDRDTGEWISEPEMFKGPLALAVTIYLRHTIVDHVLTRALPFPSPPPI